MKIRLWKLGSLEHKIFPTPEAIQKFADILEQAYEENPILIDIIWDSAISVQEIELAQDDLNVVLGATPEGYKVKMVVEALPAPVPDQQDSDSQP